MIFNFIKNKDKSVEVSNIDDITDLLADKVNAKNDEVMSLTQENDSLRQKLAASELTVSDYQGKLKKSDSELVRLNKKYDEVKKRLEIVFENNTHKDIVIQEYSERILELEEQLGKKSSKDLTKQLNKLRNINANQLEFIEILQVLASGKADKSKFTKTFGHNLKLFVEGNNLTQRQAGDLLGISKTTVGTLMSGKTNLTYDNLDILDSKMCEYFECSVYELVTVKMEGKGNRVK